MRPVKRTGQGTWVNDADVANCKDCQKIFSLYIRRHHCRHCGHIFCSTCSNNKILLKPTELCHFAHSTILHPISVVNPTLQRVCRLCYFTLNSHGKLSGSRNGKYLTDY